MRQRIIDGSRSCPLDLLAEQLWLPSMTDDDARIVVNPAPDPTWRTHERYWAIPSAARARILVPTDAVGATRGALRNYQRLRRWRPRSVRFAARQAARFTPPMADHVAVQSRAQSKPPTFPLAAIAEALGRSALYASIGVRTGANRKATLQLVDDHGSPVGYAKLAWNDATAEGIRTEASNLEPADGQARIARAPTLLSSGHIAGHPYLVSSPMPASVASPGRHEPPPTPLELASLCPLHRRALARDTGHFNALGGRIERVLAGSTVDRNLGAAMRDIVDDITKAKALLPVAERWHGDLAHWNTARDSDGRLWCWDWESAEPDVVAGLDALHWAFSRERQSAGGIGRESLDRATDAAATHLWANGTSRSDWPIVAGVYALTVAERAATLAARAGWPQVWIDQQRLLTVLTSAMARLRESASPVAG